MKRAYTDEDWTALSPFARNIYKILNPWNNNSLDQKKFLLEQLFTSFPKHPEGGAVFSETIG